MQSQQPPGYIPLILSQSSSVSESIQTICSRIGNQIVIPDYQRDANEWSHDEKSLFIESILNNITIPAFFIYGYSSNPQSYNLQEEVVDGQQRLRAIKDFYDNQLTLSLGKNLQYLPGQSFHYEGKNFSNLSPTLQQIFLNYRLQIVNLPTPLPLETRLEVFRRINKLNTPLTGQDLRLAYYKDSDSVFLIRLAGVYDYTFNSQQGTYGSPFTQRVLNSALSGNPSILSRIQNILQIKNTTLNSIWDINPNSKKEWQNYWLGKSSSRGQNPSLMFLWYLVCLDYNQVDIVLIQHLANLQIHAFNGSTETALDIYCAQLQYQDKNSSSQNIIFTFDKIVNLFDKFQSSFFEITQQCTGSLNAAKYKQVALLIAGFVHHNKSFQSVSQTGWNQISSFISSPRAAVPQITTNQQQYPEPKGKWDAQKQQFQVVRDVAGIIK